MGRLSKKKCNEYRNAAILAVQYYTACIAMNDDAPVIRFTKQHEDPDVPPTPGYIVQAWVFISDEDLEDKQED